MTDDLDPTAIVVPWSVEAEQSVLGGLLLDNAAWDRVAAVLTEGDFYRYEHKAIFAAVAALLSAHMPADVVTVAAQLETMQRAEDAGGLVYLNGLAQSVPSAASIGRYVAIVREYSMHRALIDAADRALARAREPGDAGDRLNQVMAMFETLLRRQVRKEPRPLGAVLLERVDRISALLAGDIEPGWPTRIPALDRMLNGGLRAGMLYVLAARPSVGKSSFAAHLAIVLARQGLSVLLLSQEMTDGEIGDRILSSTSRVDYGAIQRGDLDDGQWAQLTEAVDEGARLPLHIDDQAGLRLSDIASKARLVRGLRVLVLDYLQLSAGTRRDGNRNAEIEEISRGLKALAKDLGIAIIELSQLNREVEKRADHRPVLADLRDSGAIEQDADVVLLMWQVRQLENDRHIVGLGVAKNRQGQRGEVALDFHSATQRWNESTADIRNAPPTHWNTPKGDL